MWLVQVVGLLCQTHQGQACLMLFIEHVCVLGAECRDGQANGIVRVTIRLQMGALWKVKNTGLAGLVGLTGPCGRSKQSLEDHSWLWTSDVDVGKFTSEPVSCCVMGITILSSLEYCEAYTS